MSNFEKKIPEKIQIGGFEFEIKFVEVIPENPHKDNETQEGYVDFPHGIIYLRNDLGSMTIQILCHEITHCIDRIFNADGLSDENEVERISQGIYQFIKQL